ncbi:uncharacterized protein LOC116249911 isoform X2 [Nymphaea colorata]|uniref:uncharacterized protein LOC116249911 isoform X2 n=1 Tax=Nymphaea colorata TaxID=210225 RepID=UPI00214E7F74|nr:uncharacterized protein LOC116249911 isoform X2 [Nymphaea colorata]
MNNVFSSQILAEKLSKLNNSQQSIETLSHWCIFHRKKAKQVVETWEKLFSSSQKDQCISFLYLANDILQNSRRKGSEFVNEFWKVLPGALNKVVKNDDEHGKRVVLRLIDIWEERKVFGSRGSGLKDEMLAKEPPPSLENNGKSSHSIKIARKDAHSIRVKLAIGGMPERIVSAFQSVHDDHFNEDTALNKCKAAIRRVGKMEKDVDDARSHGNQQESTLANELQEQENILRQCIAQLQNTEATRTALVAQLKEALQDQESKLELIRTQLQDLVTGKRIGIGLVSEGLYRLPIRVATILMTAVSRIKKKRKDCLQLLLYWHERIGHLPFGILKQSHKPKLNKQKLCSNSCLLDPLVVRLNYLLLLNLNKLKHRLQQPQPSPVLPIHISQCHLNHSLLQWT